MSETLDKELDSMEEVTEGSNAVTKNAKPGEKIDTSKGGAPKVIDVTTDSEEGAKGTKNAGASAARSVGKAPVPSTKPSDASAKMEETEEDGEDLIRALEGHDVARLMKANVRRKILEKLDEHHAEEDAPAIGGEGCPGGATSLKSLMSTAS